MRAMVLKESRPIETGGRELDYAKYVWHEKEIKSVANVARQDALEFLPLAAAQARQNARGRSSKSRLGSGFPFDPFINERSKLSAIKPNIGFLAVHDKRRIPKNPVPYLLPQPHGRLGFNDLKTYPVAIQA
jgi:hypothetical protein